MTFDEKLIKAHAELKAAGIWRTNYNPPLFELARKLGYKTPPPHYRSFLSNFIRQTLFIFIVWGSGMMLFNGDLSFNILFMMSSTVAGIFGYAMAVYYKLSAEYHHLSDWNDF